MDGNFPTDIRWRWIEETKEEKKTHEKSEHNTTPETTFEIGEPDTLKMLEEYEPYAEMVSLGEVSIHWIL